MDVFRIISEGARGVAESLFFEQSDPDSKWKIARCDFEQLHKFILHYIIHLFKLVDPFDSLKTLYLDWKHLKTRFMGKQFVAQTRTHFLLLLAATS